VGFRQFGRGLGREIARGLCDWERRQNMTDMAVKEERMKKEKTETKKRREAYKKAFGVYPEETWR